MCLLFVAWRHHRRYPLVVAANRDEFHARASAPLARWSDAPGVIAGRDLEAGGTWLGVDETGRFAALTNFRDGVARRAGLHSRGALVAGYLNGESSAREACQRSLAGADRYAGFNLFTCDGGDAGAQLVWCSNRGDSERVLSAGIYGLSNHLLDTPWPKVTRGKQRFAAALEAAEPDEASLFDLLADRTTPRDAELPDTGVDAERERTLGAAFIVDPRYGTRASTLVVVDEQGRGRIIERSFAADGARSGESRVDFDGRAGA